MDEIIFQLKCIKEHLNFIKPEYNSVDFDISVLEGCITQLERINDKPSEDKIAETPPNYTETYLETIERLKSEFYDEKERAVSEIWKDYKCKWFFPKYRKKQIETCLFRTHLVNKYYALKEMEAKL